MKMFSLSFWKLCGNLHHLLCKPNNQEYNWCRRKGQNSPALAFRCLQNLPQNFVHEGVKAFTVLFLPKKQCTFIVLHNRMIDLLVFQNQLQNYSKGDTQDNCAQLGSDFQKMSEKSHPFWYILTRSVLLAFWPWVFLSLSQKKHRNSSNTFLRAVLITCNKCFMIIRAALLK